MNNQVVRLNKFLAERLGVSRREADDLISTGQITVNDKTAVLGTKIDDKSKIFYNNKIIPHQAEYIYLAFNKPVGYVCSRRAQGKTPTLYDLLPAKYRKLKTVGRLDKDSSGLIILTNDGDFAFQMTHPKFRKNKVYEVELNKPLEPLHQQMISDFGVLLDDGPSKFTVIRNEARVAEDAFLEGEKVGSRKGIPTRTRANYTVILSEGRNRQIRRTFAALGYKVVGLHRTQFGQYKLGNLKPSAYQEILSPSPRKSPATLVAGAMRRG